MTDNKEYGYARKRLGRTGLEVSEISLGLWTLGGRNWTDGESVGWADVSEQDATAALDRAPA